MTSTKSRKVKLGGAFYLNIMLMGANGRFPEWYPLIDREWAGANTRSEAVKLRREYQGMLKDKYKCWPKHYFRTVKITHFEA